MRNYKATKEYALPSKIIKEGIILCPSPDFFEEDKTDRIIDFEKRFINWQRVWSRINEKVIKENNKANGGKVAIINSRENKILNTR